MGILQREYGIKPVEAFTEYSEDQLQDLLSQLPTERIVNIQPGMSKMQAENKYLEALCDRDIEKVKSAEDNYQFYADRAKIKAALRSAETEEEKLNLKKQYDIITKKIENR